MIGSEGNERSTAGAIHGEESRRRLVGGGLMVGQVGLINARA